jgi:hypothetical protein
LGQGVVQRHFLLDGVSVQGGRDPSMPRRAKGSTSGRARARRRWLGLDGWPRCQTMVVEEMALGNLAGGIFAHTGIVLSNTVSTGSEIELFTVS